MCDATVRGGLARYINHSCAPNCHTKIYRGEGRSKVGIFALERVERGQELLYDYKVGGWVCGCGGVVYCCEAVWGGALAGPALAQPSRLCVARPAAARP